MFNLTCNQTAHFYYKEQMMDNQNGKIHETGTEARAGVNVAGMTTVLFSSITLVIILFLVVYFLWV
jgi:hypothetical protein